LMANTTANDNTAIGNSAMVSNTTGGNNVAVGRLALKDNTTAGDNVAIGDSALLSNTTGAANIAIGSQALDASTTADNNVAIGRLALTNSNGAANVAVGKEAMKEASSGANNTCLGKEAGYNISTGGMNVCIGHRAGKGQVTSHDYQLWIGRDSTAESTAGVWIFGNSSGACHQGNNSSSWSTTSDERIKKDIVDSTDGLAKIDALKVRNFNYRTQDEITTDNFTACDSSGLQTGVIAQELESVLPLAVSENHKGMKNVNTDPIFWAMVKAIQELSAKVKALEEA